MELDNELDILAVQLSAMQQSVEFLRRGDDYSDDDSDSVKVPKKRTALPPKGSFFLSPLSFRQ